MKIEFRVRRGDDVAVIVSEDISEEGDLGRLYKQLISEFRHRFPHESLLDDHIIIELDKST